MKPQTSGSLLSRSPVDSAGNASPSVNARAGTRRAGVALRWLVVLSLAGQATPVSGQTEPPLLPPEALKQFSLESLLDIDVTSVSKRVEKLSQAASAIQVITREEIRRSGATSIPEVLRLASNVQVAQVDSRQWAITARGFNGTTANKLLVLIDGRIVYTPLYSGVFWDVQDTLLDDIDRIEVISGPGGTLWGHNAVNGVINIITRDAGSTEGPLISVGGGTSAPIVDGIRFGGRMGSADYRVYGKYFERESSLRPDGDDVGDEWRMTQAGFRLDVPATEAGAFTLQGDVYSGAAEQPAAGDVDVDGRNLLGRWVRTLSNTASVQLQFYYDNTHRVIPGAFAETLHTSDLDFQHRFAVGGRHEIVWGLNYRRHDDNVQNGAALQFLPAELTTDVRSGFVQDEIALPGDRLKLTLGTKLEHNDFSGFEYQPSVRLAARMAHDQTAWMAVSRAVRSPSRIDRDFFVPILNLEGGPDFDSEKLIAFEAGIRGQSRGAFSYAASAFFHDYDDLRSLENTTPRVLANGLTGEAYGAELTGSDQLTPWWRLAAGYTLLRLNLRRKPGSTDSSSEVQEGDSPEHQILFRSSMDIDDRFQWDASVRYVSRLPRPDIPAYWELDLRLGYLLHNDLEFSLIGRNLLHDQHAEFGASANRREFQRSISGRLTWSF